MTPDQRSRIMSAIKKKDTKPELRVRRFLHERGLRYRLHANDLPGCPDIVFRSRRSVVLVHGCFWHQCPNCGVSKKRIRSNTAYWLPKLKRNKLRDARVIAALQTLGWKVSIVWECQIRNVNVLSKIASSIKARRPHKSTLSFRT
ncbi:MAG: very short patch repair endonuclease [Rhizobiales bacterium]|nr:very short patch repair endonuclease [Hyphomicrobiales bacterium]